MQTPAPAPRSAEPLAELPVGPPGAHKATGVAGGGRRTAWRRTTWIGGLFVAGTVALAAFDIWRSHANTVAETGRELDSLSRVIAEQTARSVQTIDRVLRHVADEVRSGKLDALADEAALHAYLRDQTVGLVQVVGLSLVDADGRIRASSTRFPQPVPAPSVAGMQGFQQLRSTPGSAMVVATAMRSINQPETWMFPLGRRLERDDGSFAGVIAAAGHIDYFQNFYRDVRPDEGTAITLMHRDGTLIARFPAIEASMGQRFPNVDAVFNARAEGRVVPGRLRSPVDGVDRFASLQLVADYPLAVIVTRDASVALATWRAEAVGTALRTLALALLATVLLVAMQRQLSRLERARSSLELSRERFALAAAGSDEGIWDWDVVGDRIYASARAREVFGLPPGPEVQPREQWFASVGVHPDDVAGRREALQAHLAGRTPVYAGEYRVQHADGSYRWVRVRGLCVRDEKGSPVRMAGSVTDIDARRRAEDALRLSEQRYALAMTGSTGGHWVWEPATDALFVSSTVNQLFGLPEDTQPTSRAEYFERIPVHPDDRMKLARIDRDVREGRVARLDFEYRVLLPGSDAPRWILTRAQCFCDDPGCTLRVAGVSVDITERKRTDDALRLSEERFALAVAGSKDGVIDWDIVNDRMYTSERMLQMIGAPTDVTVRTRAEWVQLLQLHPDDRERHAAELKAFLEGRDTLREGEYRLRAPGGGWFWVRLRNLCVRDEQGRPLRLAGSVSDIDAYKRVEAALRQSEEHYALAMTGSNEGHWVWDIGAGQVFVSAKMAELLAQPGGAQTVSADEYFGRLPVHPDDAERVRRNRERHLAGETPRLDHEFRIVRPDNGEVRWVHTRAQCFRDADGKPLRMAGATVDATQRKHAEQALRASEERFALAVAGSDDGVWDFDYLHNRVFGSRRAREILGIPLEPEVQTFDEWFRTVQMHPDDAASRLASMQAHLDGLTPAYEGEWRVRHPDGSDRWVRVRGMCVRDEHGRPLRMAGSVSDIDARKRAEESQRRSEERYALAVAGSDDGVWDWDFSAGMAFESARARELQGLPRGPELQPLQSLVDSLRVHPDDAPRRAEGIRSHLAGETPAYECEYRVRHDDGSYRWIRVRALCIRDEQGHPIRMAGSVSDIDTRKRAEQALRESEQRFALAVAGSNDGILDWDIATNRMYVSERALQIVGIDPSARFETREQWSALIMPRFHPDDAVRIVEELRPASGARRQVHDGEYRVRHADGQYRWVRFRGMSKCDASGQPIRWAGSISDIDAQKKTEDALRRSEQRYQLAVDGSNEGLWDWDLGDDTLFLSPRAQMLLWQQPGEPQRPRREWIARTDYHPDDRPAVRAALSAHLHGASRHFKVEYRVRHHSGEWRWYRQRGIAVRDGTGTPTRMAGSMEDITDRKNFEAERERLEVQLRQAQKLESIGTLAGGIAHDFNNILAAILGYGEMAQKDAPEGSALRRNIDAAISAGMRAKSLVERILAFSRSGMGERVPVHVESVVAEALDAVAASLPPGIRLERELGCGNAAVLGDPTQVHQVVMNLCANAVQAMKASGTLTVTLDQVQLESPRCATSVLADGSYVRLSVRDSGSGIAPELLERIFDPFFTTKDVGVGTGLGLSLVHGIVTDLGGGIDVQSTVGQGAVFTVYLPWQGGIEPPAAVDEAVPAGNGETVLLIDDEESLVRLGEEMIAGLGYEPVGFTSSIHALETFRASPGSFDMILSDEAMPEMTGSELALAIREIRGDIPIVLMSGYVTPAMTQRARDAGVAEVLAKPLVARDIARSLAGALQRYA
jgi:PAS domain S-box-containing protein